MTYISWIFYSVFACSQFHKCAALSVPESLDCDTSFHTDSCCHPEEMALISLALVSLATTDCFRQQPKRKCAFFFKVERNMASWYLSCWLVNFPLRMVIQISRDKRTKAVGLWNFLLFPDVKKTKPVRPNVEILGAQQWQITIFSGSTFPFKLLDLKGLPKPLGFLGKMTFQLWGWNVLHPPTADDRRWLTTLFFAFVPTRLA